MVNPLVARSRLDRHRRPDGLVGKLGHQLEILKLNPSMVFTAGFNFIYGSGRGGREISSLARSTYLGGGQFLQKVGPVLIPTGII